MPCDQSTYLTPSPSLLFYFYTTTLCFFSSLHCPFHRQLFVHRHNAHTQTHTTQSTFDCSNRETTGTHFSLSTACVHCNPHSKRDSTSLHSSHLFSIPNTHIFCINIMRTPGFTSLLSFVSLASLVAAQETPSPDPVSPTPTTPPSGPSRTVLPVSKTWPAATNPTYSNTTRETTQSPSFPDTEYVKYVYILNQSVPG